MTLRLLLAIIFAIPLVGCNLDGVEGVVGNDCLSDGDLPSLSKRLGELVTLEIPDCVKNEAYYLVSRGNEIESLGRRGKNSDQNVQQKAAIEKQYKVAGDAWRLVQADILASAIIGPTPVSREDITKAKKTLDSAIVQLHGLADPAAPAAGYGLDDIIGAILEHRHKVSEQEWDTFRKEVGALTVADWSKL